MVASTSAHTVAPTPAHTVEQLHLLVRQVYDENDLLKCQVAELTTSCNDLTSQLSEVSLQSAQFTTALSLHDYHTNVRMGWHVQANVKIVASYSRASPTHSYGCAHDHEGCNWRNKRVTLQAYILHLKWKHGEMHWIIQI